MAYPLPSLVAQHPAQLPLHPHQKPELPHFSLGEGVQFPELSPVSSYLAFLVSQ